jgi:DNA repair ATPase RecN
VEKSALEESTRVNVVTLEGEERVRELARMMGDESEANVAHARSLLAGAQGEPANLNGSSKKKVT